MMRKLGTASMTALLLMLLPAVGSAQSDICIPALSSVPNEAKAEQLRIDAAERAQREIDRKAWDVKMFTLKNTLTNDALRALCIFRIEVVNQPALHLVQIRSPKSPELLAAIEDAVKRLDVPPAPPPVSKGIELTGFIVVAMDPADPQMLPLPAALEPVAAQLKSILPSGTLALKDTFVVRGVERQNLSLQGSTTLQGFASIREGGGSPVIRLDNLIVQTRDSRGDQIASFGTSVDVPVGTQVVIGKATPNKQGPTKAVILVINGRVLN